MSQSKRTRKGQGTPWRVGNSYATHGYCKIFEAESPEDYDAVIAETYGTEEEASSRAEFIVRACNSHSDLLAALRKALDWSKSDLACYGEESPSDAMLKNRAKVLRAAIAKAEGRGA